MGRTVALRDHFDGRGLRRLAKASKDAGQSRRLLALAEIYDGGKRGDAARIGDVGLQVIRDWVLRFNARGPDGLIDGKATGRPSKLNDGQRQTLARLVEAGPIPAKVVAIVVNGSVRTIERGKHERRIGEINRVVVHVADAAQRLLDLDSGCHAMHHRTSVSGTICRSQPESGPATAIICFSTHRASVSDESCH